MLKIFHGPSLKVLLNCNFAIFCDLFAISKKKKKRKRINAPGNAIFREFSSDLRKNYKAFSRQIPHLSASFVTISGRKDVIVQIQLFKSKNRMALWSTAKCSYAHQWALAHKLKTTDLKVHSRKVFLC